MPIVRNLYVQKLEDLMIAARAELGSIEATGLLIQAAIDQLNSELTAAREEIHADEDEAAAMLADLTQAVNGLIAARSALTALGVAFGS